MSVMIRGMEKPKSCYAVIDGESEYCPFVDDDGNCILLPKNDTCNDTWEDLHNKCPLVEVPETHGRLIDADALENAVMKWLPLDPCGIEEKEYPFETDICVSMLMEIEEAETVIEAEDEICTM